MMNTETHPPLTPATKVKLPLAAWVVLTFSLGSVIGTFLIAQHQIAQHERRIDRLESDRELLTRIDERLQEIQRKFDRIAK